MAIITALALLCVVVILGCLAIAFGTRMRRWLSIYSGGVLEDALFAAGLFLATFQILLFILASLGWLRASVVVSALGGAAIVAGRAWGQVGRLANLLIQAIHKARQSPLLLSVMVLTVLCLVVDAFLAMAPLTGSDATLYHFTAPLLEVGKRWKPVYWLALSFYSGLGHTLTQLGMTLGSDRISMGFIWLAGVFTTGSLFVLTRRLAREHWAWIAALTFLLTPIVYWQIGVSGCPDIWMAFYITLAVLAAARGIESGQRRWWLLAGFFAGAAAGVKYTGWIVPVALGVCCLVSTRSLTKSVTCGTCSLVSGAGPLLRNMWWSGDPFFPYLTRWLTPSQFNSYSYKAILEDTHPVGFSRTISSLLKYPFLFPLTWQPYGDFGHFWGPLILAFAPLLVFVIRRNSLSLIAAVVWFAILLTNELTVQQPRHLLPCYPLALALALAGAAEAIRRGWRMVRLVAPCCIAVFFVFGLSTEAWYAKDFLPVVVGLEQREAFLQRMAPDYPTEAFINKSLNGTHGKVMVFFQRGYYLRVTFEIGDPRVSWLMNPDKLSEPHAILQFLHHEGIQWVVKAPTYATPFVPAFQALEDEGNLRPRYAADVPTFSGFRMYGERPLVRVVILEVAPVKQAGAVQAHRDCVQ